MIGVPVWHLALLVCICLGLQSSVMLVYFYAFIFILHEFYIINLYVKVKTITND